MIGGTGLIGSDIAARLTRQGADFHMLARRASGQGTEIVADPDTWQERAKAFGPDIAISALGTTQRLAGSRAAFRAVDFDLVVNFARGAHAGGARHMILVSSVGAETGASTFYLAVKGEVEDALGTIGFARLDILRPGLLRGDRPGERRVGERIGILLSPLANLLLRGRLDRFAAIDADRVAAAAVALTHETAPGRFVHHNRELKTLARSELQIAAAIG